MKLPTSIKIGPFNYKLIKSESHMTDAHGHTSLENKEIVIYKSANFEAMRETLQHELLHVLLEDIVSTIKEIDDADKMEEQLIRLLSPRLMSLAQDNQELAKFLWIRKKNER